MRSLEQWLAYQAQAHPQTIDLGLSRVSEALRRLGWRPPAVPVITVAGTNGKGSVVEYCTALLSAAGYRVGTFTSPHLSDYRERIRIDGRYATAAELVTTFERIEAACRRDGAVRPDGEGASVTPALAQPPPLSLSFFEYNTLAALLLFDSAPLDAWVLEVGLGGRLDAVNVVDADVAVVVSIGLDHQDYLGDTLEAIAVEKAGVFRAHRPAVIGSPEVPAALIEAARSRGALLKRLGTEFFAERGGDAAWRYRGPRWDLADLPAPGLRGQAQYANAATALAALEALPALAAVTPDVIRKALPRVRLAGRFQVIASSGASPTWILDVAHNPAAARVLADNLRREPCGGRTLAVCGVLADKDAPGIARELRGCIDAWWTVPTEGARGSAPHALAARIAPEAQRAPVAAAGSVAAACESALAAARPADRIVAFGSFHTVGPVLDWLGSRGVLPTAVHPEYTAAPATQ